MQINHKSGTFTWHKPLTARYGETMSGQRTKMVAGESYDPLDPALTADRAQARRLCKALAAADPADQDSARSILQTLLGAGGESAWLEPPFFCDYGYNILLGERVYFNFNCVVLDVCPVRIGDFTFIGPAVQIYTAMHPMDAALRRTQEYGKPVEIGSDVWIGGAAVICPGVNIGTRSVIGAGSVVTRDIPPDVLAAGNPCKVIRKLTS